MVTKVAVFNQPNLNGNGVGDSSDENANILSIIQKQIDDGENYAIEAGITSFTIPDLATRLNDATFFFMTDMENASPTDNAFLPESAVNTLKTYVEGGGIMVMTGTDGSDDAIFLNRIFGWDLAEGPDSSSYEPTSLKIDNAAGTPYEGGPATLDPLSGWNIANGTVAGFTPIYGDDSNAAVAVIEAGAGKVVYLSSDFFSAGFATDYGEGIHANGSNNSADFVTEIIPRTLRFATALASPSPTPVSTPADSASTVVLSLNLPLQITGTPSQTSINLEIGDLPLGSTFDESYYLLQNADVTAAVTAGEFATGYDHFVIHGMAEGRSPIAYFDEAYYLAQNADVKAAVANGGFQSGIEHFLLFGHKENRNPSGLFDAKDYLLNNPDVAAAVQSGAIDSAFEHFTTHGAQEGRLSYSVFQEDDYLTFYADVKAAVENGFFESGWEHFQTFGMSEGRRPSSLFDESAYLAANSDVAAAVKADTLGSGVEHYFIFGYAEGRSLS